jgi:orotate phosphoribosyltransferase
MIQHLYQIFMDREALKFGSFTLASGKKTDFYVDARKVTLCTEGASWIKRYFWYITQRHNIQFNTVGGMHTGADPIVGAILTNSKEHLEAFLWRKEVKTHGTKQVYEGTIPDNAKIILVDDVATTGGSLIKVMEGIKQHHAEAEIVAAYVVVDREEGATEALAKYGIPLYSCLKKSQLVVSS